MRVTDKEYVKSVLPKRADNANKYTVGTLLTICGSYGMAGAAVLSARAALKSGTGLLRCVVPKSIYQVAASQIAEAVFVPGIENSDGRLLASFANTAVELAGKSNAALMGCGSGNCTDTLRIVTAVMSKTDCPAVVDADGLNCICGHINVLKRKPPTIITPHEGELARLMGVSAENIRKDREYHAQSFADTCGATVVLKGKNTIVAEPGGRVAVNPTGGAELSTAGTGDVLAGIIVSLLSQGLCAIDACAAGAYLHGRAGEIAAQRLSPYCVTAGDVIGFLPDAFLECLM